MINRLVQLEQERLHALGYNTVVTPVAEMVSEKERVIQLGNESLILTGIRVGSNDVVSDNTKLILVSPTESVECTQRELSQMGTSIYKLFKCYLIIKVKSDHSEIPEFRLDFVKVTPILTN